MKHASLFSGIGGAELAATWMGWENVFHCEISEFPRKVLEYWYPNSVSYEDITTTDFTSWRGKVDILTGGFPCQPFSMAGKRLGAEDDRYLWPHMLRAIREIQPTWVVGENVAGLVTMVQPGEEVEVGDQASLFDESYRTREEQPYTIEEICQGIEREGYSVQPFVIPACAVGAPHRRDRIWIVAHRTDAGVEGKQVWEVNTDEPHALADTECSGGRKMDNEVQPKLADGERIDGNGVFRTPPNANSQRWPGGSEQAHEWEEMQAKRAKILCNAERPSSWETSSHPDINGLQNGNVNGKQNTQSRHGFKASCRKASWADFPTQSPICGRDDGLSLGLVNITFPRWRAESVKALGNAIVPQVIYEIFKAIEDYGNRKNKSL